MQYIYVISALILAIAVQQGKRCLKPENIYNKLVIINAL